MKTKYNMISIKYKRQRGLTMIEVLIAVVILSIGLLGIAGLQMLGMQNTNSANLRTQASLLAYEFADIIRTNKKEADNDYFGTFVEFDEPEFTTASPGSAVASCSTTSGCSSAEMAQTDLFNWSSNVTQMLPGGDATTSRVGDVYTVAITWADYRANADDRAIAGVDNPNVTFSTSFQP